MRSGSTSAFLAAVMLAAAFSGCASLPPPPAQKTSTALADPATTPLGQLVARATPAPARSGFRTLIGGDEAFDARTALADAATRTLDLQYYIAASDRSTHRLLEHVRAAARRGVRVRVLLDDLNTSGADAQLLPLMAEPNVEVRLFNPFPAGRASTITRILSSLTDVARVNKRMHNKLFVADNALAITGGRNLGDSYFVQSESSNFVDLDLLIAGAAVRPLSRSFDGFWNNPLAYPASMFIHENTASHKPSPEVKDAVAARPVPPDPARPLLSKQLADGQLRLVWAPARVLADAPSKLESTPCTAAADAVDCRDDPAPDETLVDDMERLLRSARRNVLLISPYFVPGERGMAAIRSLRERGVSVQILTNSLAASDAPLVHVGYVRYRRELLTLGVALFELKPSVSGAEYRLGSFGSSTSRLHAKALIVDREWSLVGTMNFDPRSDRLNSEAGVLLRNPQIAAEITDLYTSIARDASYHLSLDSSGCVQWTDPARDNTPAFGHEPGAKRWLRLLLKLLSPLAPEEML